MIKNILTVLGPQHKWQLYLYGFWLIAFAVLQGLAMALLVPLLQALLANDQDALMFWLQVMLFLVLLTSAARYQQTVKGASLALLVLQSLHRRLGDHLTKVPLSWFDNDKVGRLSSSATSGTLMVTNIFAQLLPPVFNGLLTPITVAFTLFVFNWYLGFAALLSMPLIYLMQKQSAYWIAKSEEQVDKASVEASNRVVEFARHQSLFRAFGKSIDSYEPLEQAIIAQSQSSGSMLQQSFPRLLAGGLIIQLVFIGLLTLAIWLHFAAQISAFELIALLALITLFTGPLAEVAGRSGLLRMAMNDLDRLTQLLNEPAQPEVSRSMPYLAPIGTVQFDNVSFAYQRGTPVLNQLSFTMQPQTTTAIVGASGSGKSTITKLLLRFWDVDNGSVKVNGTDVKDLTTSDLMSQVSVVMQEIYLFNDTLEANIRFAKPKAKQQELYRAAELAGVNEIIQRLPDGWQTVIGEGGSTLSGGEKQRVSIARALLKAAPIVILDEATAALDTNNERFLSQSLQQLKDTSTLIVITHQLNTVADADQILVLSEGQVSESGNHAQLLALQGQYAHFWQQLNQTKEWQLTTASTNKELQ
ncbi:ABC transporter ATP-binding protein [Aliivibrio fischeri]|uniref:ABC transporter n=1 Tax=Aliivibrio fischeri TaxID=668 RepID=A0A510ULY9_ALIFS|nr:ABC transporter ATP-binding protein [Aliivibrio fischeri]MUK51035.1 ATP-binding cassette domain-containing protein [Aliivibrio fischeri]GEK15644.1 ABC transporter [Aliivibrio fischeri]